MIRTYVVAVVRAAVAAMLLISLSPAPAVAIMEDDWPPGSLTTDTNPGDLLERETSWRWNWGNSLYPNLNMQNVPSDPEIVTTGFLYAFDQTSTTVPNASFSQPVEFSSESSGTVYTHVFDVLGISAGRGFDPYPLDPPRGINLPGEGQWWIHIRLTNPLRAETPTGTLDIPYGVDLTAPRPVANLRATIDGNSAVTTWTPYTRRIVRWDTESTTGPNYDDLSGAGAFEVTVNGELETKALCPMPDPDEYWWADDRGFPADRFYAEMEDPNAVTIESLPPGRSEIQVTTIDRATNRSTPQTVIAYCDPDVPKIEITGPEADGGSIGSLDPLTATATDKGGVQKVDFYVDGVLVGTDTPASLTSDFDASLDVDWSGYTDGTHAVRAVVTDMLNRTEQQTWSFELDRNWPRPAGIIVQPQPGQRLTSAAPLRVAATDTHGITDIDFEVDGAPVGSFTPFGGSDDTVIAMILADLTAITPGNHTLTARVSNTLGNTEVLTQAFEYDPNLIPSAADYWPVDEAGWGGTTTTNPDVDNNFWREGWGNSLNPQLTLTTPTVDPKTRPEMLYTWNRSPSTRIDITQPQLYERSALAKGTHLTGTADIQAVLDDDASADGRLVFPGHAQTAAEGWWYMHADILSDGGNHTGTMRIPFGIDVTDPSRVANVRAYPSAISSTPLSGWSSRSKVNLRWDSNEYDSMSGTAYFRVYVDGACLIPGGAVADPVAGPQGVPWYKGANSGSITIEDLSPGQHTFSVSAVDRATNEGLKSTTVNVGVDPDVPTVRFTTPSTNGATVGVKPTIKADADDEGGIASVRFYVDGVLRHTDTSAPYTFPADLSGHSHNEIIDLEAVATDMVGRTASDDTTVKLDKSAPSITSISGGPNPFYPRKRDGYKDNLNVHFTLGEDATCELLIYDSSGKFWRNVKADRTNGYKALVWNGKSSTGSMKSGTFKYKIRATDKAGNSRTSSYKSATIKYYQIIRLSNNSVKVIQR
ncbi:MAG: Ig-like domain-containing protein [Coriobacteriales bacterium]|nr:Ig-like domain-containing protein [Coriobacteriales bacterium]